MFSEYCSNNPFLQMFKGLDPNCGQSMNCSPNAFGSIFNNYANFLNSMMNHCEHSNPLYGAFGCGTKQGFGHGCCNNAMNGCCNTNKCCNGNSCCYGTKCCNASNNSNDKCCNGKYQKPENSNIYEEAMNHFTNHCNEACNRGDDYKEIMKIMYKMCFMLLDAANKQCNEFANKFDHNGHPHDNQQMTKECYREWLCSCLCCCKQCVEKIHECLSKMRPSESHCCPESDCSSNYSKCDTKKDPFDIHASDFQCDTKKGHCEMNAKNDTTCNSKVDSCHKDSDPIKSNINDNKKK